MLQPKILIVEDDREFAEKFRASLSHAFTIEISCDPESLYRSPNLCADFDALIIDLHMPKVDGLNLCAELRKLPDPPLMFILTNDHSESAKLMGLKLRIEDYLEKSMPQAELELRIANRLSGRKFWYGTLEVFVQKPEARLAGRPISLTQVERAILLHMLERQNCGATRDSLMGSTWKGRKVVDHTLNSHVHNLNKKLENWEFMIRLDKSGGASIQRRSNFKNESLNQAEPSLGKLTINA